MYIIHSSRVYEALGGCGGFLAIACLDVPAGPEQRGKQAGSLRDKTHTAQRGVAMEGESAPSLDSSALCLPVLCRPHGTLEVRGQPPGCGITLPRAGLGALLEPPVGPQVGRGSQAALALLGADVRAAGGQTQPAWGP